MPNTPHGDRIRDLEKSVASQSTQQEATNKALDSLNQAHQETVHKLDESRRELEKIIEVLKEKVSKLEAVQSEREVAVLVEKVSKLEQAQNRGSDRLWTFLSLVLSALIGAVCGSVVTWLLTHNVP